MTVTTNQPIKQQSLLEKPILASLAINWELVLYTTILLLAMFTRFYDLGSRVMSHDESLHALFSYKLYDGDGYTHDPLTHGPLQFHLVAFSYLLFGDNDFSARIPAALFGVALVILPYWFRPWLGKLGALVTSFGLLVSPMLLYYERYIRNESLIALFTALLALSLFQYMRNRQQRWLYIGAMAVSLSLATKEVAFIHGFIGVVFISMAMLWEQLSPKNHRRVWVVLTTITALFFAVAFTLNRDPQGLTQSLSNSSFSNLDLADTAGILFMVAGLLFGIVSIAFNVDRLNKPMSATLATLPLTALVGPVILSTIVFFLFHTTFFTNLQGFYSGTIGAITYWLKQQDVARGGQPGYYYLLLMPLYEFLPFFLGGIGGLIYIFKKAPSHTAQFDAEANQVSLQNTDNKAVHGKPGQKDNSSIPENIYPSDGGTFAAYLIFWTISSFTIYSWAGEKMPWLTVHITLPFIFLLGHVSQSIFNKFNWQRLKKQDTLIFLALLPLLLVAVFVTISADPFQGQSIQNLAETYRFVVGGVIAILVVIGLWYFGRTLQSGYVPKMVYLVIFCLFSLLTVRFAWLSSFVNYDYVNEFLVYAHGSPDVKWMLNEIDDISQRTVGDKQIKVAYGGVIWPLEWYMREYPNRAFYGSNPNRDALDAPIVIISPDPEVKLEEVEPYLGKNYQRYDYRQVWWPIEDYKNQTAQKVWNNYVYPASLPPIEGQSPEDLRATQWDTIKQNREWLWNVIFYRRYDNHTFKEWPFRTQMYFFVRKDILNELWNYQTGPIQLAEGFSDPYEEIGLELPALRVWGSNGSGNEQFTNPRAITVSPQGQVYVVDSGNHRIQVFDQNGTFLKNWGSTDQSAIDYFGEPWGIAISGDGKVYISDTWNHRVLIFNEDGEYQSQFGAFADTQGDPNGTPGSFWGPRDILIDGEGNLYISDTGNKRIQKFSPDGEFLGLWGGGGVIEGRFEEPVGLAVDSLGNLYVADAWNQRIQKFDSDFNYVAEWPVVGWESQLPIHKPFIAIDSQDRVFVTDPESYRVIVYSSEGDLLSTFGEFGQDVQSFKLPLDLAFGPDDTLFVVDGDNNRVMKFQYPEVN